LDDFAGTVRNEEREYGKGGNFVFRYMRHVTTLKKSAGKELENSELL
jgi:hypothetical protein